jgi:hypothetical protein
VEVGVRSVGSGVQPSFRLLAVMAWRLVLLQASQLSTIPPLFFHLFSERHRRIAVLAPPKRRASLYTLPIMIMIGFLSVVGLAAWQRSETIADLADRVARGEKSESASAVRQLAAIPKPPLAVLVEASASDERVTAETAQVAINRLLGQWQKQVDTNERTSSVAAQLTELTAALAAHRDAYAPADYPWLAGATRKVMRIAEKCPPKKTPLVALHCDEIFAVVERNASRAKAANDSDEVDCRGEQAKIASRAGTVPPESQQSILEREFLSFPTPSITNYLWPGEEMPTNSPPLSQIPEAIEPSSPFGGIRPATAGHDRIVPPADAFPIGQQWSPADGAVRPEWSLPIFRVMPLGPADAAPESGPPAATAVALPAADGDSQESAKTRALIAEWNDASEYQRHGIEEKLADRGFRRMSSRLVKQYLSDDSHERLRVVDSVLTEPDVDPRPWLLLLADDEDAEIRLQAVTVMATSNDERLIEAAWETAIGDRDPRIADLAERLKARRR